MATFTKIPPTYVANTLGKALGKTVGAVGTSVGKSLDKIEIKIENLQRESDDLQKWIRVVQDKTEQLILEQESKTEMSSTGGGSYASFLQSATATSLKGSSFNPTVSETALLADTAARVKQKVNTFNITSQTSIRVMKSTLDAAAASIRAILKVIASLKAVVVALRVPIPPFKVIIKIIKLLPIPQRYLIVSFTVIESDLLEFLEQLIAQAEEEITGIESIIDTLENILRPLLERIERIRASLNLLGLDCRIAGASTQDQRILDMYGLIDRNSGQSLISRIQKGLLGSPDVIDVGGGNGVLGYGIPETVDLTQPVLANQLTLAKEGDVVGLEGTPTGSYIETWFCSSSEQPEFPVGFPTVTGSWTKIPQTSSWVESPTGSLVTDSELSGLWKVDLKVTGKGTIFGGLNETASQATLEDFKAIRFEESKSTGTDEYRVLGYDNFNQKPGILKVDDWNKLISTALTSLQNAPLSQDLKDDLVGYWNEMVTEAKQETGLDINNQNLANPTKFQWRSKTGELYDLEVVEDEHSPAVAVRRFIRVKDSNGTVILDGIKTFSTNIEILLQEIKLQLDQLTQ